MTSIETQDDNQPRSFPRPGTGYYGYTQDENYHSKFLDSFKYINKVVRPLYRWRILPLLGAHHWARMYVITTIGRKSGKKRETPLEYFKLDGVLYGGVSNPRKSQWHKNILANPDQVWVQLGFHSFQARIEFLDDEEFIEKIKLYALKFPKMAATAWGWDPERDDVETADFSPMLRVYRFFRIHEQ
ncbi:MAG: nitroreductase family deazaflavin-dependent oxidoreductase [Chloroflexi bacterium]|nr:nitroreductase family deazaflavin-dependent oxidoreductase [Chloroflexota bacterium]